MGLELRIARRIAKLTQHELAARADVDIAQVSRLESGIQDVHRMAYGAVVHIALALGVDNPLDLFPVEPATPRVLPTLPRLPGVTAEEQHG